MNYSNNSRKKTEQTTQRQSKQVKKKGKITAFRVIIMTLIIAIFAVVGGGLGIFIGIIKSTPDVSTLTLKPQGNYTSFVYDDAGNQIASFKPEDNREYVELSQIPINLQHAVIATEDERFYEHNGIDIKGIFRAIVKNLTSGKFKEGASTITQQLVKNNVLKDSGKRITRKIQEQYLAIQFEKTCSKAKILEYYLNTIGLSQGVSGVQSASKRYFGKDVSELSLTECVVLAVITQYPTYYDPIRNPENNWDKVQVVLQKMEDQGYITAEEHAAALLEYPYDNIESTNKVYTSNSTRPYFVDALFTQLKSDLMDLGYSETDARNMIYGDGLKIYSTQNQSMQATADKYIQDDSQYPAALYKVQIDYKIAGKKADGTPYEHEVYNVVLNNDDEIDAYVAQKKEEWGITSADTITTEHIIKVPQPQACFVLMDHATGEIKALSGARGEKTADLTLNYVTQAKRQPGSVFKVLAAYAPALDLGYLGPDDTLVNERKTYYPKGGEPYTPTNWDNNYSGTYTVTQAIANSMNVLAVKTAVDIVGLDTAYDYLLRFGFTTLTEQDKVLSLPLGGITDGVTPLELNAAYGAIANDGVYVKPIYYTHVVAADGTVIIDNRGSKVAENSHTVLKQDTARLLTDMMQEVVDGPSAHTGGRVRQYFPQSKMPVAGKTGTTTKDVDLVFSGYTPYYVATIWTGYSIPDSLKGANNYHLKIWGEIMNEIHENLAYKSFPKASISSNTGGFKEVKICTLSGKLATEACEADPDHVVESKIFTDGNAPTSTCDVHSFVEICTESGKLATENCPAESRKKVLRIHKEGETVTDESCDIHGTPQPSESPGDEILPPDSLETPIGPIESTPPNDSQNGDTGNNVTPDSSIPPTTPSPSIPAPEPSLPPTVTPSTPPSVDDDDDFVIPQY